MRYERALLADDDPVYRLMAEELLFEAGIGDVETADDGETALALMDRESARYDLLVSDLNMPTRDGVGLIRGLTERGFSGAVVICSAEAPEVLEAAVRLARLQGLRVIGGISKPLRLEKLVSTLAMPAPAIRPRPQETPVDLDLLDEVIRLDGIRPHFQPKVCLQSGRAIGAEALMRVEARGHFFGNPVPFIDLAESNRRIDELTFLLARRVFNEAAGWKAADRNTHIAINISPVSLQQLDFPDRIASEVRRLGLSASDFTLEVTETQVAGIGPAALDVMTRLRIKGFGLSVDDFGAGFSNIDRLRHFPFTELKIDQSFVRGVLNDSFSRLCVEAAVRFGHELGMKVVAEGVETDEVCAVLGDLGVDVAQGWLFSRALPPDQFADLLGDPYRLGQNRKTLFRSAVA
jgi:EAL domain-containing protein (putative c-di-GMP-specific phosphodiesterase class I)